MGGEDHLFFRVQAFAETGTIDVDEIRGWLGPWVVGGWVLTPNQEWMRCVALYCAGVTSNDPLRDPRAQLLAYLKAQRAWGHQYLGPRPEKPAGLREWAAWREWQASVLRTGWWDGPWPAGLRDSWSEQDSDVYENFHFVPAVAARRRALEIGDGEVLAELDTWFGHHAARLSAVPLPPTAGYPVSTPGSRTSEPILAPRQMAYHLLVRECDRGLVDAWRGDNRAAEMLRAAAGSNLPRFVPRDDVRLKHPIRLWRGDDWWWQTCRGLPRTKPGPVSTVAAGRRIEGGASDPRVPGVMWHRKAIDLDGRAVVIGGSDGPPPRLTDAPPPPSSPPPATPDRPDEPAPAGRDPLFDLDPSDVFGPARFGWLMDAAAEGKALRDKAIRYALAEEERGNPGPANTLRRLL